MTPTEVAHKLISLGICYQLKLPRRGGIFDFFNSLPQHLPEESENFEKMGYNAENQPAPKEAPATSEKIEVITDPIELMLYDGWRLAKELPTGPIESSIKLYKPVLHAYLKNRKLFIQGDDIPFGPNAMRCAFSVEFIKDIKLMHTDLLAIDTICGPVVFMVPKS